jgi:hypothetical protein
VYNYYDVVVEEAGVISNPQLETVWNLWPNYPPVSLSAYSNAYFANNILWVLFHDEGWLAFDLSDPSNPLPLGTPRELIKGLNPINMGYDVAPFAIGPGFAIWDGVYPPSPSLIIIFLNFPA